MGLVTYTAKVNSKSIENQLSNLIDDSVMLEIHKLFAEMCNPYVPMKTGRLRNSATPTSEGVTYKVNYAKDVYENNTNADNDITSREWDKIMMRDNSDQFIQGVKEILKRRAKELYG